MSCRTGPLRVVRAFARLFTASLSPPDGRDEILMPTIGRPSAKASTRHEVTALRAGGPSGRTRRGCYDEGMSKDISSKPVNAAAGDAFAEVVSILARLRGPGGCPWDREQTLDSIKPHTLEETYEVFDAIDRRAWPELRDELGDLLLQVLFYAQIAADDGHFKIDDVVRSLSAKLIRRHPHVFGDAVAETAADVNVTWEAVKQQEREGKPAKDEGLLGDVPQFVPALVEARKLGSKAAKVGFDWPDVSGLFDKVQEEIAEVRAEISDEPDAAKLEEEIGDLYFVLTNLSRHLSVDPEQALRKANAKFRRRFRSMEQAAGDGFAALPLAEKDALWDQAKLEEKKS